MVLFHNDKEVLIIANKKEAAKNMLLKIKLILNNVPEWMYLATITENNVHTISFNNGCSVKSIASADDAGRSHAAALLVVDEAAHVERMREIWKGVASVVSTGGKVLAMSTPKGQGNWFHEYFVRAQNEEIDWHAFITHWWENPDYAEGIEDSPTTPGGKTSPWFRKTTDGWSRQQIAQELLTGFVESGDNFFSVEAIEHYQSECCEPIDKSHGHDRNLWVWERPKPGYRYLISADVCHGSGEDFSVAHVIELKEIEVVAEFRQRIPPDLFGDFLVELAKEYNDAYICPESQGIGNVTGYRIKSLDYRNLCFFDKESGRLIDKWTADYKGISPGLPMTVKERPVVLAKLEEFLRKRFVKIYSRRFLNEMQTFIMKNGKPQAENGMNDDTIMSLAIGVWVRDMCPEFRGASEQTEIMSAINAITINKQSLQAVNSRDARVERHKNHLRKVVEQQKVPINRSHGYNSWLFKV